ncbi:C45 family peptidase [Sulfitobacter sp. LCG007]
MTHSLTFDAVAEARPGTRWKARWDRSWPAYEAWFRSRGGDAGPSRADCEAALRRHMPELVPVHAELTRLAGGDDRAARFLSAWCPPAYLGGCSVAAFSRGEDVRLIRNYDLAPELNEGFLLRSEWRRPVMGMVEFLWGLSDGINDAGLSVALAYGGSSATGQGFGITTILRYLLETCDTVPEALAKLARIPSHMAYNLVLADRSGQTASVELAAGGGVTRSDLPIATNHQALAAPDRPGFTLTRERRRHLAKLITLDEAPDRMRARFLEPPLFQRGYDRGFGTLFTAEYDPAASGMVLAWPGVTWSQSIQDFREGRKEIRYGAVEARDPVDVTPPADAITEGIDALVEQAIAGRIDWMTFARRMAQWDAAGGNAGSSR